MYLYSTIQRKLKRIYGTSTHRKHVKYPTQQYINKPVHNTAICRTVKIDKFPMNMFDSFLIYAKKIDSQMNILKYVSPPLEI